MNYDNFKDILYNDIVPDTWSDYDDDLDYSHPFNGPNIFQYSREKGVDPWEDEEAMIAYLQEYGCAGMPCSYMDCDGQCVTDLEFEAVDDELCVPDDPRILEWFLHCCRELQSLQRPR